MAFGAWLAVVAAALAPATLERGPVVTETTGTGATITWSGDGTELRVEGGPTLAASGRVDGLEPGRRYRYAITGGGRVLARGSFRTDPGPGRPVRIAVFGDHGDGGAHQRRVARLAARWQPDVAVSTGDNVYLFAAGGALLDPNLFRPLQPLLRRSTWLMSLGNHDTFLDGGATILAAFDLPGDERWYVQRFGPAAFVVLDSNSDVDPASPQGRFLREAIRATEDACPRFAVFHHPPFSPVRDGIAPALRRHVVPLLEEAGFTALLLGHVHSYDRSRPRRGVTHLVVGTGGAEIGRRRASTLPAARTVLATYGALRLDVDGDGDTRGRFYDESGRVRDDFRLACR